MNRVITKENTLKLLFSVVVLFLGWVSLSHAQILSIQDILWAFVNNVFGYIAGAMGALLNSAVQNFVIGFGSLYLGSGGATSIGGAVDNSWVAVRDIFNLTFIFGLVYIGFKMILNSDDSGTRRWLVNLILAALLVNFSLFITKFIVDFSNLLAAQIVNAGFPSGNISDAFMNAMNITTVFSGNFVSGAANGAAATNSSASYTYIFGAAIVFLIMAFVFAAGAFMLLIRFIALCFYMIMSPLMFLGWVFPQFSGITSRYWSGFLGRAFFAPIYVLLLYFAYNVLGGVQQQYGTGVHYGQAFTGSGASTVQTVTTTFTVLTLGAGFLLGAVIVSSKMGADGANMAINVGKNLQRRGQRFVTQQTVGRGARVVNRVSEATERGYRRLDANLNRTNVGRKARDTASVLSMGLLSDEVVRGTLGAGQKLSVAGSKTAAQQRKEARDRQLDNNAQQKEINNERTINQEYMNFVQHDLNGDTEKRDESLGKIQTAVGKLTEDQALNPQMKKLLMENPQFAAGLGDEQIKKFKESGRLRNDEMDQMEDMRDRGAIGAESQYIQTLESSNATSEKLEQSIKGLNSTMSKFSNERMENYINRTLKDPNAEISEAVALSMTEKHLEHLKEKLDSDKYKKVTDTRKKAFENIAQNGAVSRSDGTTILPTERTQQEINDGKTLLQARGEFMDKQRREMLKNPKLAESLPASVYANSNMAYIITPQILQKKLEKGGVSEQERRDIERNVQDYITNTTAITAQEERNLERIAKAWENWSEKTTVGSNFSFRNTRTNNAAPQNPPQPAPAPAPQPAANPNPAPAAPQNPFNRFGDPAEAQRWADWEAQNNPNYNP